MTYCLTCPLAHNPILHGSIRYCPTHLLAVARTTYCPTHLLAV